MTASAHQECQLAGPAVASSTLAALLLAGADRLRLEDPELHRILEAEYHRQSVSLPMVASSSIVDPSVLACQGTTAVNVTAEGYPGRRYHAGCGHIDEIEQLAIDRAKDAFGASYANVQPHSASIANEIVLAALLRPGDTLLGMDLRQGGHLTHGAPASISGTYYRAHAYGVGADGLIDCDRVLDTARACRPKVIICGATAYPRLVDFERFRTIADAVGALLIADISHVAGLVIAGLHPSPIDHAHVTTTCTHKQLYGPRGGLILMGRDHDMAVPGRKQTLAQLMQQSVFPFFQGAPAVNVIAAKARALAWCGSPGFKALTERIVADARALARAFERRGYHVISGGTDNHIVLLDLRNRRLTGITAQRALDAAAIVVNMNLVPGDPKPPSITSGLRLGTNSLAHRGMGAAEMDTCADLAERVLAAARNVTDRTYDIDPAVLAEVRERVRALCERWPIPEYPRAAVA
jgi:glycine hydroxymethyltransferase